MSVNKVNKVRKRGPELRCPVTRQDLEDGLVKSRNTQCENLTFRDKDSLANHLRTRHTNEQIYLCTQCGEKYCRRTAKCIMCQKNGFVVRMISPDKSQPNALALVARAAQAATRLKKAKTMRVGSKRHKVELTGDQIQMCKPQSWPHSNMQAQSVNEQVHAKAVVNPGLNSTLAEFEEVQSKIERVVQSCNLEPQIQHRISRAVIHSQIQQQLQQQLDAIRTQIQQQPQQQIGPQQAQQLQQLSETAGKIRQQLQHSIEQEKAQLHQAHAQQQQKLTNAASVPSMSSASLPKKKRKWGDQERADFMQALDDHGRDFVAIARAVGTRTRTQCISYAQNFFSKAARLNESSSLASSSGSGPDDTSNSDGGDWHCHSSSTPSPSPEPSPTPTPTPSPPPSSMPNAMLVETPPKEEEEEANLMMVAELPVGSILVSKILAPNNEHVWSAPEEEQKQGSALAKIAVEQEEPILTRLKRRLPPTHAQWAFLLTALAALFLWMMSRLGANSAMLRMAH